jgi:hypothetical protein
MIRSTLVHPTRLALWAAFALMSAQACAPAADDSAGDGMSASAAATSEPRVTRPATAAGEMPPAILGNGGALEGMDVQYLEGDPATQGYLAVPDGEGPFPALIIIHEWNGLVDRVRQVADDFAAEGYVTLAADLYGGRTGSNPEENMALVGEAMGDMPAVVANVPYTSWSILSSIAGSSTRRP